MALKSEEGFVKLLVEVQTRKILACHIVGHEASTLLHEVRVLGPLPWVIGCGGGFHEDVFVYQRVIFCMCLNVPM